MRLPPKDPFFIGSDFAPFGTDTTAKYFSYSSSQPGPVDTSVLADVPTYGVFNGTAGTTSALTP